MNLDERKILFYYFFLICFFPFESPFSLEAAPFTIIDKGVDYFRDAIRSIAVDKRGTIFFGTYGQGMGVLQKGGFRNFRAGSHPAIPENRVNCLFYQEDRDRLLIGTCGGIAIYDLASESVRILDQRSGLARDFTHTISGEGRWVHVGTTGSGLCSFDGSAWRQLSMGTTGEGLGDDWINGQGIDGRGTLWLGTAKGIFSMETTGKWGRLSPENGFPLVFISQLDVAENHLWVSSFDLGIARKALATGVTRHWTEREGLPANEALYIDAVASETAWVATTRGIAFFRGETLKTFTRRQGLMDPWIKVIQVTRKGVLAGSHEGILYKKVGGRFEPLVIKMKMLPGVAHYL